MWYVEYSKQPYELTSLWVGFTQIVQANVALNFQNQGVRQMTNILGYEVNSLKISVATVFNLIVDKSKVKKY